MKIVGADYFLGLKINYFINIKSLFYGGVGGVFKIAVTLFIFVVLFSLLIVYFLIKINHTPLQKAQAYDNTFQEKKNQYFTTLLYFLSTHIFSQSLPYFFRLITHFSR